MSSINSRRSIRKYTTQQVTDEQVTELLRAAMSAPSAGNQQPWRFVVIRSRELLEQIPTFHPHASMTPQASLIVAVCGDMTNLRIPERWVQDCSAATENLLLAAHAQGLGACWVGLHPGESLIKRVKELLSLPASFVPMAVVSLGQPGEQPAPRTRYNAAHVRAEKW